MGRTALSVRKEAALKKGDMIVERNVYIPMRDGVRLAADIFRPSVPGNYPALLAVCPYSKDIQGLPIPPQPRSPFYKGDLEAGNSQYFVSRGYVHIIVDIRGTGKSEGEFFNVFSLQDQRDGFDIIEWIAQQPWCNGNVGMVGISYFAVSQYLIAAQQPPHLKAIFPLDGWTDLYRHITYQGGIYHFFWSPFLWNQIAATQNVPAMSKIISRQKLKKAVEQAMNNEDIRINPWLMLILANPQKNPVAFDFLLNPDDGPFYQERSAYTKFDRIKCPVYCGSRWDSYPGHLPGAFASFKDINSPKKLIITPGAYERPWYQYHEEIVRWYDYWLKGLDNDIMNEPPIKIFVPGKNEWRYENEWPLARTKWTKFLLGSHERLQKEPGIYADEPPYSHEPDCFVHQSPVSTNKIQSLKYLTPKLNDEMEVTGHIVLHLFASIDTEDTNFIIELKDVDEIGNETKLTEGWLKASHRRILPEKSEPWLPFHPHTNPEPVKPGQIVEYDITVNPTCNVFKPGHRIQLEITSTDFTGNYMHMDRGVSYHLPRREITLHKIYRDREHQSYLLLPVIPRG